MSESNPEIPEDFCKVCKDFIADILTTFPEYQGTLHDGLIDILQDKNDTTNVREVFDYVKTVYPERFFDLLYQNEDMFADDEINTKFLPNIEFSELWNQDISDKTKLIIWKYLQLLLFAVVNNESDGKSFGDTAKLFEAINEDELKNKLEETMEQMANIFDMSGNSSFATDISNINPNDLPDPEELHSHINGMLQGNLGKLAAEITEETMKELNTDVSGADSVGDIFQNLFKNPGKLMSMIKKVGSKLDTKLKSGEIKESEIMQEAMDLMDKMEKMPGMANMKNMLNQMGMPGMGKNSKVNMGAMRGKLNQNMKVSKQRERMLRKLEQRKAAQKDNQIKLLQQQLAAAKKVNQNSIQTNEVVETTTKKKRRRKKKKRPNKK
ncbi:MAG: hypothetical protein ACXADW_17085 [Candidatus Hodarchaeales archaeon]|jgi:hypothetical protein